MHLKIIKMVNLWISTDFIVCFAISFQLELNHFGRPIAPAACPSVKHVMIFHFFRLWKSNNIERSRVFRYEPKHVEIAHTLGNRKSTSDEYRFWSRIAKNIDVDSDIVWDRWSMHFNLIDYFIYYLATGAFGIIDIATCYSIVRSFSASQSKRKREEEKKRKRKRESESLERMLNIPHYMFTHNFRYMS